WQTAGTTNAGMGPRCTRPARGGERRLQTWISHERKPGQKRQFFGCVLRLVIVNGAGTGTFQVDFAAKVAIEQSRRIRAEQRSRSDHARDRMAANMQARRSQQQAHAKNRLKQYGTHGVPFGKSRAFMLKFMVSGSQSKHKLLIYKYMQLSLGAWAQGP